MYDTTELQKVLMGLFAPIIKETVLSTLSELDVQSKDKDERYFTREEFAKRKGVSLGTLWRWENAGILKGTRRGSRVFYRDSDLIEK